MYEKYSEAAGLRILAFPCNQFGGQEPGTEAEIKEFATGKYNVTFDMFSKINVNGAETHPLWVYLKVLTRLLILYIPITDLKPLQAKQGGFLMDAIKWNFTKFVVNKEGQPVARFGPTDDPIPKVEDECKKYF